MKKNKPNYLPTLIKIFVVLTIILVFVFIKRPFSTNQVTLIENNSTLVSDLPTGWQIDSQSDTSTKIILSQTDKNYQPTIVYYQNSLRGTDINPANFVDQQIAGAKSTISRLTYTQNQLQPHDSLYIRLLTGSYYDKNQKISLLQRIYVDTSLSQIHTLTASYVQSVNGDLTTDINTIFDTLASQYITKLEPQI